MPKCVRCNEMFPPNYVEVIKNSQPTVDGEYPKECIFCKLQVSEVERETKPDSGKHITYTKDNCLRDYKDFLEKLKHSKNVQDIMNKTNESIGAVK